MRRGTPLTISLPVLAVLCLVSSAAALLQRDAGFGAAGEAILPGYDSASAEVVVLQPDGKIVVAGSLAPLGTHFSIVVARYEATGALDALFGTDGIVELFTDDPQNRSYLAPAIALQDDGRIVLASGRIGDLVVVRLLADGTLDGSFGSGGVVASDVGNDDSAGARAVAVQDDGRIVVAGSDGAVAVVARYLADGTLDPTFGSGGLANAPAFVASSLAIQPDGRIVVAGHSVPQFDLVLSRHLGDGSLDPGFGTAGVVTADLGGASVPRAMLLDPHGNIVIGGWRSTAECTFCTDVSYALFARFLPDGTPDPTFGNGGFTEFAVGANRAEIHGLVRRVDGTLLGAGRGGGTAGVGAGMSIAAVGDDGVVDATIHPCAQVVADGGAGGAALQPDGRLVVVGLSKKGFTVRRYADVPSVPCQPAERARLRVKNRSVPFAADLVALRWQGFGDVADFGDPTASTDLVACVVDDAGPPALRLALHAPSGDPFCGTSPCWSGNASGYDYKKLIDLGAGRPMLFRTSIGAKRGIVTLKTTVKRGDLQLANALPITGSAVLRVARSDGPACWEATFPAPSRNGFDYYAGKVP